MVTEDEWPDSNEGNIFADAIKATRHQPNTTQVTDHPNFFQDVIDQEALKAKARKMTRQDMFNNGLLTVADMDDEELRCGRMRDGNGRIPKVTKTMEMVPRDLYDEMVAEHQRRTHEKFRQQLDAALDTMVEIMTDQTAEPRDRADAAKYLMERVIGKTPERVQVAVAKAPWEEIAMEVGRLTRAEHEQRVLGNVVDAEVVETQHECTADVHGTCPDCGAPPPDPDLATDPPPFVAPTPSAFAPAPPVPSHDNPMTSNPVVAVANSERMRWRACDAAHLAQLRAEAKDKRQGAKKRRIVLRTMGLDSMQHNKIAMDEPDADEGQLRFKVE